MTARERLLKLTNGSLPPWAIKVLVGISLLLVSWGTWVTASTFNTNNSRFTGDDGQALEARVDDNHTNLAVQAQRFQAVEQDLAEIKAQLRVIEGLVRNGR